MSRRILLADDSVTIQKVVELTFSDGDFEVVSVSSGEAALAKLEAGAPDILISDVHMPGIDGYEVCRRAKERFPSLPVLLLVGTFEPFEEGSAHAAGASSFLKKPFDARELQRSVNELATSSAAPAAAAAAPVAEAIEDEGELDRWDALEIGDQPDLAPDLAVEAQEPAWGSFDALPDSDFARAPLRDEAPLGFGAAPFEPVADTSAEEAAWSHLGTAPAAAPEPAGSEPAWRESAWGESSISMPAGHEDPADDTAVTEPAEAEPDWGFEAMPAVAEIQPAASAIAPPAAAAFVPAAAPVAIPAAPSLSLSDDDVDRIARRVVELIGEKAVRDIAWEVVPDLAEVLIKDRLSEIERQAELEGADA